MTVHEWPELWGGIECTVNRVGGRYFDQVEASGHAARLDDLDRFAELGLVTLRYPVLWERAERGPDELDFSWPDERLSRLRELGIRPIVGLLHHGSGPRHTSLLDPEFPGKFARYARAVAERYPWVQDYTPINEPLTTARFSALYGHWYPHRRDDRSFVRALLNQCWATHVAMEEIRRVNPAAQLVQTEDVGYVRSTAQVAEQAAFENARRFLSFDLLTGGVTPHHPLYDYLVRSGATPRELAELAHAGAEPDLLGVNYYVTSERFLDHRTERYPAAVIGGNGFQTYADVEAVRVCDSGLVGPGSILVATHARYRTPVAITEAHLGCDTDERCRWLSYVFQECRNARAMGADVRAMVVWALLGSYGWARLLTEGLESYEPGIFELRDGIPYPTRVAGVVKALARGVFPSSPSRREAGWWAREERLSYPPFREEERVA